MSVSSWASVRLRAWRKGNGKTVGAAEHCHGGPEYASIQAGEQAGDLPAVGRGEVTMSSWRAVNQTFEPEPPEIIGHLVGSVFGAVDAQQIGDVLPQI